MFLLDFGFLLWNPFVILFFYNLTFHIIYSCLLRYFSVLKIPQKEQYIYILTSSLLHGSFLGVVISFLHNMFVSCAYVFLNDCWQHWFFSHHLSQSTITLSWASRWHPVFTHVVYRGMKEAIMLVHKNTSSLFYLSRKVKMAQWLRERESQINGQLLSFIPGWGTSSESLASSWFFHEKLLQGKPSTWMPLPKKAWLVNSGDWWLSALLD